MVTVMTMILISMMSGVPWLSVMTVLLRVVLARMLRLSWISTRPARIALMTMLWRVMILM